MNFSDATILITGGNSGIGRGLAEALSSLGAKVIITGRNAERIMEVLVTNPGMSGYELDVSDEAQLDQFVAKVIELHPDLNAIVHNAGIMVLETTISSGSLDLDVVDQTVNTNLLAPIRLTAAMLPHLLSKEEAAVVTVSSGLAFVPRANAPTYSATKAAIHSWSQSLRHELRETNVSVVEIVPPLVATDLTPGQSANPRAMPLDDFVKEAVRLLCNSATPEEVLVDRVMAQRTAERTGSFDEVFRMINPV